MPEHATRATQAGRFERARAEKQRRAKAGAWSRDHATGSCENLRENFEASVAAATAAAATEAACCALGHGADVRIETDRDFVHGHRGVSKHASLVGSDLHAARRKRQEHRREEESESTHRQPPYFIEYSDQLELARGQSFAAGRNSARWIALDPKRWCRTEEW